MGMDYNIHLLNSLELPANTEVAYYWVEDNRIQYWNFTDDGWLPYKGSLPLQEVCDALNAYTKEHHSHEFREYYEHVNRNPGWIQCYLIEGGPLSGNCVIDDGGDLHTLPADALDVLGLPVSEVLVMPDHNLWELMWEGVHYRYPCINVYLLIEGREDGSMSGGNYTVHIECSKPVLVSNDRSGTRVHVGSLEECLSLEGHMREVFDAGKKLVADSMRDTLASLVGREVI
jgi:hypothetical protein